MAIPPVVIQFLAQGVPDVSRAMRSVGDIVASIERASTSSVGAAAKQRIAFVDQEARARSAAARRGEREFGAALRSSVREAEQAAKAEIRAAEKAGAERIRIAQRVAAEERRLRTEVARAAGKAGNATTGAAARLSVIQTAKGKSPLEQKRALELAADLRIADVGAKAQEKAAQRVAQARIRAYQTADREEARARAAGVREFEKAEAQKNRGAMRWVREQAREQARVSNERRQRYGNAIAGAGSEAVRGLMRGGTALASTALQLGGGFNVQDTLHEKMQLDRRATLLSNKDPSGRHLGAGYVTNLTRKASIATGMDEGQLLGAWEAYADKTGDCKGGAKNMEFVGKLSKATGADVGEIAKTAGLLRVQNKDLDEKGVKEMLLNVVAQGRSGAVDFGELAGHASSITKSSSAFAGDQATTQRKLLALSQVGVRTGSVAEAATMISNLSQDAGKHSASVNALLGHNAFNEKGQIADAPERFLADVIAASGGNRQKLQAAGFGARSIKLFDALLPTFNAEEQKALKGGKSKKEATEQARQAVLTDIGQFTDAKYGENELQKDFTEVMSSSAEKFEEAVRQMKRTVADELVPALIPLIGAIREATPHVRDLLVNLTALASWASRNPLAAAFAGVGLMVGKAIIAEYASAKVGEFVKSLLSGGGGGVGGGSVPGKLGKGLAVVGAGLVAGELTKEWVDEGVKTDEEKRTARRAHMLEGNELAAAARRGALTPEQRARAKIVAGQLDRDQKDLADEMDPSKAPLWKQVTGTFANVLGGDDAKAAQQTEQKAISDAQHDAVTVMRELMATMKESNALAKEGNAATKENTTATKAGGAAPPPASFDPSSPNLNRPMSQRGTGPTPR